MLPFVPWWLHRTVLQGCYRIIECNALVDSHSREPLPRPVPGRFMYLLFTSGSTDEPKGVLLSQRAVTLVIWEFKKVTAIDGSSVSLQTTPFTFDIHVRVRAVPVPPY